MSSSPPGSQDGPPSRRHGPNGSNPRFDFTAEVPASLSLGSVHFIAIGGAGMSGVARVMLARGMAVSGSDAKDSLVLTALAAEGADVHVGHDASHLEGVDTVVISSAIREDNVELRAARERGLRVLHRSQALASVMRGHRRVAVAGTNGKTTTTSMLTVALQACGVDPSFAVGGELAKHGTNAHLGTGDIFVAEADESDGSFLVYRPDVAIVTSVQPDHLDFYGTFEAVRGAYAAFAATVQPGGLLVTCADDPGSRDLADLARSAGTDVVTYGLSPLSDVRLTALGGAGFHGHGDLVHAGVVLGRLEIGMPGKHNLLNAAAAFVAATRGLGQDPARVLSGLAGFTGTRRRFEPKGEVAGVRVVDDYAHNPGKVAAVVETARTLAAPGRLIVVFQPHLYSRTRDFAAELAQSLSAADIILVMDVYAAREDPMPGVSGALITDRLAEVTGSTDPDRIRFVPFWSEVAPSVVRIARPGDLVLTVGAGDVTMIGPEILRLLGQGPQPTAAVQDQE
ncbi:MAG: UDP-N-acetylmuramate--L-alanine ligase [Dermatophilaceae bacterium]